MDATYQNPNGSKKSRDKIKVSIPEKIDLDAIPGETGAASAATQTNPLHTEILARLIAEIQPVNFRQLAALEDDTEKLQKRHYLVLTVQQVLDLAAANDWGLCKHNGFIYLFNGAFWAQLDPDEMEVFLGEAAEKMAVDRFDARHFEFRQKLFRQFLALARLPRPEPPTDTVWVNLQNGTLEIAPTGARLREFRRDDFLTYQLPFAHTPDATAPMFQRFLNEVLPDPERQRVLAEFIAYVFVKPSFLKLEKALILYGGGANGKSVLFEVVEALLGKTNVSNFSLQSLTDENGYSRAKFVGKLLNYASEINGSLEQSRFKQLVSGEPIEARLPYGQPFSATDYGKLVFNCNGLPKDVEQTDAFFRRFLIIPFDVTIPPEKQDKRLAAKIIAAELPGVLNWVLDGLNRLSMQKDFSPCQSAADLLKRYRRESDSVQIFLDESGYQPHPKSCQSLDTLYKDYKIFCHSDGYRPGSKKTFRERLEALRFEVTRRNSGKVVLIAKVSPAGDALEGIAEVGESGEARF